MAIDDAYAEAADFRARTSGKSDDSEDTLIDAQLKAISRYIEQRTGRCFNQDASAVARYYPWDVQAVDSDILWLPDADIATVSDLAVKVDTDGDYVFTDEDALTINDDFWLWPPNADKGPEPRGWEALRVNPGGTISAWPLTQVRSVEVTAKFGWPAVPDTIVEATIAVCRELRDLHEAGLTMTMDNIDTAVRMSPHLAGLMMDLQRMYTRPRSG